MEDGGRFTFTVKSDDDPQNTFLLHKTAYVGGMIMWYDDEAAIDDIELMVAAPPSPSPAGDAAILRAQTIDIGEMSGFAKGMTADRAAVVEIFDSTACLYASVPRGVMCLWITRTPQGNPVRTATTNITAQQKPGRSRFFTVQGFFFVIMLPHFTDR